MNMFSHFSEFFIILTKSTNNTTKQTKISDSLLAANQDIVQALAAYDQVIDRRSRVRHSRVNGKHGSGVRSRSSSPARNPFTDEANIISDPDTIAYLVKQGKQPQGTMFNTSAYSYQQEREEREYLRRLNAEPTSSSSQRL
ncbi:hypothetical protein BGZ94_000611 [Podila epigama]|nr:hypothetical protein BGZ94_000611 [Podila epigama]